MVRFKVREKRGNKVLVSPARGASVQQFEADLAQNEITAMLNNLILDENGWFLTDEDGLLIQDGT